MSTRRSLSVQVALVAVVGCASQKNPYAETQWASCTVTPAGSSQVATCQEWEVEVGTEIPVYQQECAAMDAPSVQTSSFDGSNRCDQTGAIAVCTNGGSPAVNTFWYPPSTVDQAQAECADTFTPLG